MKRFSFWVTVVGYFVTFLILAHVTYAANIPGSQLATLRCELDVLAAFIVMSSISLRRYILYSNAGCLPINVSGLKKDCEYVILAVKEWPNGDLELLTQTLNEDPKTLHLEIKKDHRVWFSVGEIYRRRHNGLIIEGKTFRLGTYCGSYRLIFSN